METITKETLNTIRTRENKLYQTSLSPKISQLSSKIKRDTESMSIPKDYNPLSITIHEPNQSLKNEIKLERMQKKFQKKSQEIDLKMEELHGQNKLKEDDKFRKYIKENQIEGMN